MVTVSQIDAIVRHLVPFGATKIGIFGSFARNENKPGSDLDVLVFLDPNKKNTLFTFVKVEQELSNELGIKVDLVTDKSLNPLVRPYVEKDLKIIFQ